MLGDRKRLESAEAGLELSGEYGVGEARAVDGGELLENAEVFGLGYEFLYGRVFVCIREIHVVKVRELDA